ncbi:MAG: DUF4347 domain-containing protein [Thiobacillus sp.]|nr:DUF4347 domain-containing protein [Thiobacillus sp.]
MLNKLFRRRALIEELEPRLLYSADLAPFALDSLSPAPEHRVIQSDGEFSSVAATIRNELVIIDSGVQDYETLLADILGQAGSDRHFSVVVLDANRDGIEQISEVLKQYGNLDAVHLISHGGPGSLQLGNSPLDAASLDSRAAEITAWGAAFNADADWLIYGCDVATGAEGEAFVQRLSQLIRTDVAASNTLTGNTASGGDWDLEFTAGHIETRLAMNATTPSQWQGLLETLANITTANKDNNTSVAVNPTSGAFVVTWTSDSAQDGDKDGIFARIYDSGGNPISGQILVNTITQDKQLNSAVAMDSSGNFVVVWESKTIDYGIFAQRFDATGAKTGGLFIVNLTPSGDQTTPAIAMAADGQFVVAWQDDRNGGDIYVRHFNSAGAATSNEIQANTNTSSGQYAPAVAIKDSGSYVVTWQSDTGGSGKAIFAQRFNAADVKLGGEFRVNTYESNDQTEPAIAMAPNGSFVIAWSSNGQDGSNRGVYAQRYDPSGVATGIEFRVNTYTSGHQDRATVAMDGSGNFVIAWTSDGQDNGGSYGIYAQRYFANGTADGGEFRVNTTTSGDQQNPSSAMSSAGKLVVAWDGNGPGDDKGVFWQSYELSNTPPVANPDATSTDEDTPVSSVAPGVLGNDTDPDVGAVLSVINILAGSVGTPSTVTAGGVTITGAYGSLLIRQNGSYTYTPNATTAQALAAGQVVTDVFTYTLKDDKNATATSTLTVTVNGLNDAPVANTDNYAVTKNDTLNVTATGVLSNDIDVDTNPSADTLYVTQVNGLIGNVGVPVTGAYGTLTLYADGSLLYVSGSVGGFVDSFTYQVSDGKGGTSITNLNISVADTNMAPVANDDAYTVDEDSVLSIPASGVLINDTDIDGNILTATLISGVSNGMLVFNSNGSFTYTPNANFNGIGINGDSFTYQVSDGSLTSNIATVTLSVTSVNDDPVAYGDDGAVNQDATLTKDAALGVLSNDTDVDAGDPHAVILIEAGSSSAAVSPGTPGALTTSFGTLTLYSDGSYSYIANGEASKALAAGDTSDDIFNYTMRDAAGATSRTTLTITITGSNDAPVITSGSTHVVVEETPVTIAVTASDAESDTLSFSITGGADAAWFTIEAATGLLSLKFVPDYELPKDANLDNIYEVVVTVSDGNGGTHTLAVQLVVTDKAEPTVTLPGPPAPPAPEATPDKKADAEEAKPLPTSAAPNEGLPKATTTADTSDASVTVVYQSEAAAAPAQMIFIDGQVNRNNAPTLPTLVTLNQMLGGLSSDSRALQMLQNSLGNGNFLQQLDQLQDAIRQQLNLDKNVVASTLAVSTGLSVGYVIWLVRGGVLLSSLLTSLPAWRLIDPLPILGHLVGKKTDDDEDDSLESMLKKSNEKIEPILNDSNEVPQ